MRRGNEVDEAQAALKRQRRRFTRRALMLGAGQVGLFGLLGWRLHQLQVEEAPKYTLLSDENRINVQLLAPARGAIVDRFGQPVANNLETYRVLLIPDLTRSVGESLDRLEAIIPVGPATRARAIRLATRQSAYIPIVIANKLTWQQFAQINVLAPQLPGIQTDILPVRRYHNGHAMAHIVGYVGAASKSEIHDDPVVRLPGFRVGKSGVERGFEEQLRGEAGNVKLEVDAYGRAIRKLDREDSEGGRELVLTIDQELQEKTMERLSGERRASVVALDVRNGEVIIMASTPSYDPNMLVDRLSADGWRNLAKAVDDPLTNKALRGQYPPGSTFKMVTALAGLEAGAIDTRTTIHCWGGYSYHNAHFGCWRKGGHRAVKLHKAIQQSCDVYFYTVAEKIGISKLSAMGQRLGLGQTYDFGMPLQKPGVMPTPDWKRATLGQPWYGGETVIAGIGQGYVLTTPLQLAVMTARIASGNKVLPRIRRPDPDEKIAPPEPLDIPEDHLEAVRKGMWAVVNEAGGTAGRARLEIPGVEMAGKTGTSQVHSASSGRLTASLEWEQRDHALFVAYAPADNPRYAVAAVIEHGGSGSATASPIVRDVMTALISRDPVTRPGYVSHDAQRRTAGEKPRRREG